MSGMRLSYSLTSSQILLSESSAMKCQVERPAGFEEAFLQGLVRLTRRGADAQPQLHHHGDSHRCISDSGILLKK